MESPYTYTHIGKLNWILDSFTFCQNEIYAGEYHSNLGSVISLKYTKYNNAQAKIALKANFFIINAS